MNKLLPWVIAAFFFTAIAAVLLLTSWEGRSLSFLPSFTEEGYAPYDPLLLSDSFSPTLWGGPSTVNAAGDNGDFVYFTDLRDAQGFQTKSFWLEDFKTDYFVTKPNPSGDTIGTIELVVGDDRIPLLIGRDGPGSASGALSLFWNDLANGEWQLLQGNRIVAEGTGPVSIGFSFEKISARAGIAYTVRLENPRSKVLFGCDTGGMTVVDACVGGPQVLERHDLPDWIEGESRFCLENKAVQDIGGASAESNRVYYELANGPLSIAEGTVWRFQYLNPGVQGKVSYKSLCEEVSVEDKVDVEPYAFKSGPRKITWVAAADALDDEITLNSESNVLLSTEKPVYTGQEQDNHDPEGDSISYPQPDDKYWSFSVEGVPINGQAVVSPWLITLKEANAIYRYGDSDGEFGRVRRDDWSATYELFLAEDYFSVSDVAVVGEELRVSISNEFRPATAVMTVIFTPQLINQPVVETTEGLVGSSGAVLSVPIPSFDGAYDYDISLGLKTDAGVLDARRGQTYSFDEAEPARKPWWVIIWDLIKEAFS